TILHHTHPAIPHYDSTEWDWLRGALSMVDRDFGPILDHAFHGVTHNHVIHHLFPTMPLYHNSEATEAVKHILGTRLRKTYGHTGEILWNKRSGVESRLVSLQLVLLCARRVAGAIPCGVDNDWCQKAPGIRSLLEQWKESYENDDYEYDPYDDDMYEEDKDCYVALKFHGSVDLSFRRAARGGVEAQQFAQLRDMLDTVILSNLEDRWRWDLNGSGSFRVCDVRNLLDEFFTFY
ncbi:hypothetical protein Tco_0942950, partial [Tanacetum coccineum]